jgi:hypothetical protein
MHCRLQDEILTRRNEGEIGVSKLFFAEFCQQEPLLLREVKILQKSVKTASDLGGDTWKRCRMQRKDLIGSEGAEEEGGGLDRPALFTSFRRFSRNLERGLYTHSPEAEEEEDDDVALEAGATDVEEPSDPAAHIENRWKSAASLHQPLSPSAFSPVYYRRSKSRTASYSSADGGSGASSPETGTVKSQMKKAQRNLKTLSRQGSANISRHNSASSVASFDSGNGSSLNGYMNETIL